ncbi:MAG: NosD domain-containing protein, partial [Candidatus Hadarchaeales archaeon]
MRIGALLALLFLSLAPVLAVDVDKCTEITQPGYYRLVNDISGLLSGKDYCIKISASNVVLDGQGFSINGTGSGKGILVQANNVTIKNVSVSGYYDGIFLSLSSNNTIENCTLSGNYEEGIHLYSSNNNIIRSNKVSGNVRGIYLHSSSNNLMENNMISNNNDYGIHLSSSSDNIVKNNDFTNCGLYVYDSYNNRVENNLVNGKPLVYLENASNQIISNAGQVILVNSNNITIRDLVISNASVGIELWNSSNVSIRDCTISGNYFGIYLGSSGNNVIKSCIISGNNHFGIYLNSSGNNLIENNMILGNKHFIYLWSSNSNVLRNNEISYNDYGIYLHSSSNNIIYNNIFNNTKNVEIYRSANTWNTTLQQGTNILGGNWLGGNAWLKPDGTGYSQTCTDSDGNGICDEPYQLAENNIDYLPLSVQMSTPTNSKKLSWNELLEGEWKKVEGWICYSGSCWPGQGGSVEIDHNKSLLVVGTFSHWYGVDGVRDIPPIRISEIEYLRISGFYRILSSNSAGASMGLLDGKMGGEDGEFPYSVSIINIDYDGYYDKIRIFIGYSEQSNYYDHIFRGWSHQIEVGERLAGFIDLALVLDHAKRTARIDVTLSEPRLDGTLQTVVSYTYEGADLYEALIYEVKEVRRIHLGTWLGIHWEEGGAKTEFSEVQIEWRESTYSPQTPPTVAKLSPMDVYWLDFSELGVDTDGDGFKEAIVEVSVPSMPEDRWMDIFLSTHYGRGKIDATLITPTPINFEKKEWSDNVNVRFRIPNVPSGTYKVIVEERERNSLIRIMVPIYEIRDNLITPISGIGAPAKWSCMDLHTAIDEKGFSPAIWEISPQVITVNPGEEFDLRINFTIRQYSYFPSYIIWQVFLLYSWSPTWPPKKDYYVALYDGIPSYSGPNVVKTVKVKAPQDPGEYYIWVGMCQYYGVDLVVRDIKSKPPLPAHVKVIVRSTTPTPTPTPAQKATLKV